MATGRTGSRVDGYRTRPARWHGSPIDWLPSAGEIHHGYFLPAEGANDALALFSFPSLADYERYYGRQAQRGSEEFQLALRRRDGDDSWQRTPPVLTDDGIIMPFHLVRSHHGRVLRSSGLDHC